MNAWLAPAEVLLPLSHVTPQILGLLRDPLPSEPTQWVLGRGLLNEADSRASSRLLKRLTVICHLCNAAAVRPDLPVGSAFGDHVFNGLLKSRSDPNQRLSRQHSEGISYPVARATLLVGVEPSPWGFPQFRVLTACAWGLVGPLSWLNRATQIGWNDLLPAIVWLER